MSRDIGERVFTAGQAARNFQRLVQRELHCPFRVPLGRRIWAWRKGFLGFSSVRYELTPANYTDFVSDYARYVRTPSINGRFGSALNNKVIFSRLVASYGLDVPEYYCIVTRGRFVQVGDRYRMSTTDEIIESILGGGHFVVKPYGGGSGVSVSTLNAADGQLLLNGAAKTADEMKAFLNALDEVVLCEFVRQHEYASTIFPDSTNSIRLLSMWDYDAGEPFIPFAGHRFGRPSSAPVDNCSQGGLSCQVDVETGVLGVAHSGHTDPETRSHTTHPDTGAKITGLVVPHWQFVTSKLLEVAKEMSYIPYVGWDVVVTDSGFTVIEGNNYPDLGHQVYLPLLSLPRVRAFYQKHNIV